MAVSQSSIAKELGLARMTVSRALRGENGIAEETRQRIFAAAREAGLSLPPSRKLAGNSALHHVICALGLGGEETVHPIRMMNGMRRGAKECASELLRCDWVDIEIGVTEWPAPVTRHQADGVLLVGSDERRPTCQTPCPIPQVYMFQGPPDADRVAVDDFGGGLLLGAHLAAMGHRHIAFIGPDTRMAHARLAGIRTGLENACRARAHLFDRAPLTPVVIMLVARGGQEPEFMELLLAGETNPAAIRRRFTAIACYNDWFAVHAIQHLNARGLRVPQDLSITGFDNVTPRWYDGPKLTTCAIPLEEIGAEAARFLYWRIEHPNAIRRTLMLEGELVEGETTGELKSEKGKLQIGE
jgi:DNA-binding LacI/PurR family transcriptional regulator